MDIPYRKFFFVLAVIGPLFACALPNFAALAPTPVPQPTEIFLEPESRDELNSQPSNSAMVEPPPSIAAVEQLPPAPIVSATAVIDPTRIKAGLEYQITGNATVVYTAAGNRPFVVRLSSSAGSAQIRPSDGSEAEGVNVVTTATQSYYTVPIPSGRTYEIALDAATAGSMTVQLFDLTRGVGNISTTSDFVGGDDLIRSELNMSPNLFYIVILQPFGELDAVMELYDTAGIVTAQDEGGVGEPELFFVSPSNPSEWAIVIYSYLDSLGEFTLDIYEFP
ncbi:MAG: hypothetical protein AB8G95_13895 [Anaerolineae bacterium]